MKKVFQNPVCFVAALAAVSFFSSAEAVELSEIAGFKFAEDYAFSTNRSALIGTLRPKSKEWYVYSILNAQTEGRVGDAEALLDEWDSSPRDDRWDAAANRSLRNRQHFLCWDRGNDEIWRIRKALGSVGISCGIPGREVEVTPNMYPSSLSADEVSFAAFRKSVVKDASLLSFYNSLENAFRFLAFTEDAECVSEELCRRAAEKEWLPDTPGVFEHIKAFLAGKNADMCFKNGGAFRNLTIAQLDDLAKAVEGKGEKDFSGHSGSSRRPSSCDDYVKVVLSKLLSGKDDDPFNRADRESVLKRRVEFAESLGTAWRLRDRVLSDVLRELLEFYAEAGDYSCQDVFWRYLRARGGGRGQAVPGDALIGEWLEAAYKAGKKPWDFHGYIDVRFVNPKMAEFMLLDGRPASEVDIGALALGEFEKICNRVELKWAKSNPRVFPADGEVVLEIDVKNVPKMRIAVYELDAAAACRELKGEVSPGIDLDCAVPTFERVVEYSALPVLRHREKLSFPELGKPGLYVVECSGQGVASRVLVRKGSLRVVERRESSGHVFTALDRNGRVVNDAVLWLDGTAFKADENGEIAVPFAATAKSAGKKTAVVGAGRLSSAVSFDHAVESYSLDMAVLLPPEQLVAGREATMLIRPALFTSGAPSSLKILDKPVLSVVFTDLKGRKSVKTIKNFYLSDDAESVCRFIVPENLRRVEVRMEGSVNRMIDAESETLSCTWSRNVNAISSTKQIAQLFLRRTSCGYRIECRGRTGEKIASRPVELKFKHRTFRPEYSIVKTLQFDADGAVALGALADIESVSTDAFGGYVWDLRTDAVLPSELAVAEGETVEIPVRGLFNGEWPGAKVIGNRVSLLAVNKDGEYMADCIGACSYSNGVLKIKGLASGDYKLRLRTEMGVGTTLSVMRTRGAVGEGGVIMSAARAVTDTGAPGLLRINGAAVSDKGVLEVFLANFTPSARVHVFASRTFGDVREGASPYAALGAALVRTAPAVHKWTWNDSVSEYVSGRDLGDKLRYILERRQEPGRIGNMLQRPSLLLNPWTTSETDTDEVRLSDGGEWDAAPGLASMVGSRSPCRICASSKGAAFVCRDFLPDSAAVFANLRPDEKGLVSVDVSRTAGMQDLVIVVTDGSSVDCLELASESLDFVPRDLRLAKGVDAASAPERTKSYSTIGELYSLFSSLDPDDSVFAEFAFLADWDKKNGEEKRVLYGRYACHELDFFLYEKDPAFFNAVIAPHLANKRLKDFMDRWLLGEDVSGYAAPGCLQNLNALEQCLLARRVKAVASAVADRLAGACDAAPSDPEEDDRRLAIALDDMSGGNDNLRELASVDLSELKYFPQVREESSAAIQEPEAEINEGVSARWSNQRMDAGKTARSRRISSSAASLSKQAAAAKRRAVRQLWRPPERTKEWVESFWYRCARAKDTKRLVPENRFWRDYARAVLAGGEDSFRAPSVLDACSSFSAKIAALAVTRVGFSAEDGVGVAFARGKIGDDVAGRRKFKIERYFFEADAADHNGSDREVAGEFLCGMVYRTGVTVFNPTAERRRVRIISQIPEGAFPVGGCGAVYDGSAVLDGYQMYQLPPQEFYFPFAGESVGRAAPVFAVECSARAGSGGETLCKVVRESSGKDTTSWRYVSQKASKAEVLGYLRTNNLAGVDLKSVGWRFVDGEFAHKVLSVLESRGVCDKDLWLAGLKWKGTFDARRIREALSLRENLSKLARELGPVFKSSLVEIEPEESGVFEHREYWPIVNARTHAKGGAVSIANRALAAEYRAFLDILAARKELSAGDRLLAAVFLLAQDRINEAEKQIAAADASGVAAVETRMQLDYLRAYLAFSRGDVETARTFAAKWADAPTQIWRGRFRDVLAQADEIAGRSGDESAKSGAFMSAPSLALRGDMKNGIVEGVILMARGFDKCTLKAYPIDAEIRFSKNPFAGASSSFGGMLGLKPAWTKEVFFSGGVEERVPLPRELCKTDLVLVASGAEGRVEERLELVPGSVTVQIIREARRLCVCRADGSPLAGAYVKVYAQDVSGREIKFHKDGYTDLRGMFDYESVSTDTEFRPSVFAVFVQSDEGARTFRIEAN